MNNYIVVFEGTGLPGSNHLGIRTMTSFPTKEAFHTFLSDNSEINAIAQGISQEEADMLVRKTSMKAYIESAVKVSDKNPDVFSLQLANIKHIAETESRYIEYLSALLDVIKNGYL